VITLAIDHLSRITDSWGTEVGGLAVQHAATQVRGALREVDLLARPEGAEFVVLLPETNLEAAVAAAERIRHALETTEFAVAGRRLVITASFGVAACPDTCTVATDTVPEARAALERSKRDGTNRVFAAAPRR
jgi:two-component system, cell cycle response regulator